MLIAFMLIKNGFYLITKICNKQRIREIAFNNSFNDLIKISEKCTKEP